MSQLSMFAPVECPCGDSPAIVDNDIVLWCLCDIQCFEGASLAESLDKYNTWREGVEA